MCVRPRVPTSFPSPGRLYENQLQEGWSPTTQHDTALPRVLAQCPQCVAPGGDVASPRFRYSEQRWLERGAVSPGTVALGSTRESKSVSSAPALRPRSCAPSSHLRSILTPALRPRTCGRNHVAVMHRGPGTRCIWLAGVTRLLVRRRHNLTRGPAGNLSPVLLPRSEFSLSAA